MPFALLIAGAVMAFCFGIVIGSFLNVCIYRLPAGESLLSPPSHCPSCNTRLRPVDLVPLFSYLFLHGKCRYCGKRISGRYFTIEFITGLLFIAFWIVPALKFHEDVFTFPVMTMVALGWIWASAMLVTFMIDLDTTYVIEPVTWVAMAAGIIYELIGAWYGGKDIAFTIGGITIPYLPAAIPGMVVGFLVFLAMDLFGRLIFRKPSMGLGDSFIGAAIGAMLGPALATLSFGIAIALGAIIGIILIAAGALSRKPAPGSESQAGTDDDEIPQGRYMPFGPFLTASAVLVALMPDWIANNLAHLWHWWIYQNPLVR